MRATCGDITLSPCSQNRGMTKRRSYEPSECEECGRTYTSGRASVCDACYMRAYRAERGIGGPFQQERAYGPCSYKQAHTRVRRHRGRAADQPMCVNDCGRAPTQWSYDHNAASEELTQKVTLKSGLEIVVPYSGNSAHYSPRCRPCHKAFDFQMAKKRKAGEL